MKKNQSRVAKISHPNTPHHGLRAFIFSPITTIFFWNKRESKKIVQNILMIKLQNALDSSHKSLLT
jgi:hypothetical protein